jgi:hypothetical protein
MQLGAGGGVSLVFVSYFTAQLVCTQLSQAIWVGPPCVHLLLVTPACAGMRGFNSSPLQWQWVAARWALLLRFPPSVPTCRGGCLYYRRSQLRGAVFWPVHYWFGRVGGLWLCLEPLPTCALPTEVSISPLQQDVGWQVGVVYLRARAGVRLGLSLACCSCDSAAGL